MKNCIIPIELSAKAIEHQGSTYYYISHIFNALREHKELLTQPDYKHLYDEAIDYLFRHAVAKCDWEINERERCYEAIELLADLLNSKDSVHTKKYTMETVNFLLEKRKVIWNLMLSPEKA